VTNKSLLRSAVVNESANGRFIVESFGDITELDQAVIEKTLALQTKSNFLSNISHELRTPMHGIMGFTDLLAERSEEMGGSSKSYITELKHSANRLWGLLEKLFQAASLEENTVQLHTTLFDFSIFIEDLRKEVALTLDKGTNHFELNYDSTIGKIGCDVLKLHQILIGLLENAFKYTKNGEVELVATIDKKQDARFLRVCVKDTGIGISENKQYEIFNLFEQEDGSVNRPYQGAGLGLAISRQLAILMGGDITVKSVQGKGSEFILSLPV
jgi:signal transduction histidine kinase